MSASETETKTRVAALDALFQPLNRSDAPGLVVGVAQHGTTVYRQGFGMASIQHGRAVWQRLDGAAPIGPCDGHALAHLAHSLHAARPSRRPPCPASASSAGMTHE